MEKEKQELSAMLTDELDISLLQGMRAKKSGLWMKDFDFGSALDSNCGRNASLSDKDFKYLFRRAMPGVDPHGTGLLTLKCVWCHEEFDTRMIHAETCCVTIRGANRHSAQQTELVRQVRIWRFCEIDGLDHVRPTILLHWSPSDMRGLRRVRERARCSG